jgi:hypothetical protein
MFKVSLSDKNFIQRGCTLKNTNFIYALICYAGIETKIMLNSRNTISDNKNNYLNRIKHSFVQK